MSRKVEEIEVAGPRRCFRVPGKRNDLTGDILALPEIPALRSTLMVSTREVTVLLNGDWQIECEYVPRL